MQDSGKPEDAGTAKPEGAGTEATRETISRRQGNVTEGKPEGSNPRQSRKVWNAGRPANPPGGATGSARPRGNPRHQHQRCRWIRTAGRLVDRSPAKPEDAGTGATRQSVSAGATGGARLRGKPQASAPEVLKDARFEATRRSIAGKAGRCGSRGNLVEASGGATEGVESGATCNPTQEALKDTRDGAT
jgi:hypothetical protein